MTKPTVVIPAEVAAILTTKRVSLLAAWRQYRGISQKAAAEALGVGQSNMSYLERNPLVYNAERLAILAKLYDCEVSQLIAYRITAMDLSKVQLVHDAEGEITFALVPFDTYVLLAGEENVYEDIPHTKHLGIDDDVLIPNDVVGVMSEDECGLLTAWRKCRGGKTMVEVSIVLNIDPLTLASYENGTSPVPDDVLERLAVLYGCTAAQLKE